MKVFNLTCVADHRFEGWFGNAEEFERQLHDGLVGCPMCDSHEITRLPSAPRLNFGAEAANVVAPTAEQLQAAWLRTVQQVVSNTEDVGERFAEEARRIHYDRAPERGIRGLATELERQELADEGIEVLQVQIPAIAKGIAH
jgi:hypothetical protein